MELAEKLRARLGELRYTQADLVAKTGLSSAYISELLNGKRGRRMSRSTSVKLRRALRVRDSFFDLESPHVQNRIGEQVGRRTVGV